MVDATRGLVAGTSVVFWAFATWLIPVLLAAGWWRHGYHRIPLTYEATLWSIVFPLGMYAVAGIYLGRADHLPIVHAIGSVELWFAFAAWALSLAAMLQHVVRTVLLPAGSHRRHRRSPPRHAERGHGHRTGVRLLWSTGRGDESHRPQDGAGRGRCRCRRLTSPVTTKRHRPVDRPRRQVRTCPLPQTARRRSTLRSAQIDRQFGKGSVMRLGDDVRAPVEVIPTGSDRPGRRARHRRAPARPRRGDLRPGVLGQDHGRAARGRQRAEGRRHRGVHRRRARARPGVRARSSASTPTRCWSPSRTPVSRRSRSPTC